MFSWASQSWTNLICLLLTFRPVCLPLIMGCWLQSKLLGPGTTIYCMFDKYVEQWEHPNLYLCVTAIMMLIIMSALPVYKPAPSRLTKNFTCLQSWVPIGDPSEGLVSKYGCSPLSKSETLLVLHLGFAQDGTFLIILENLALLCLFLSFSWLCNGNKTAYSTVISQSTLSDSSKGHLRTKHY